jgi:hypothetical protein
VGMRMVGECRPPGVEHDRTLPNGGVGRSCRTLRRLRAPAHLLQLLRQPALPKVPGRRCQRMAGRPPGRTLLPVPYFHVVFTLPGPIAVSLASSADRPLAHERCGTAEREPLTIAVVPAMGERSTTTFPIRSMRNQPSSGRKALERLLTDPDTVLPSEV